MIAALDPGTEQSALVLWTGSRVIDKVILPNDQLLDRLNLWALDTKNLVIEQIRSYGMAVGKETYDTVHWSGRFHQRWLDRGGVVALMPRAQVKLHLCGSAKAKDPNVWIALTDRFGLPGVKKKPGTLYGVTSHERAALALGVTWWDINFGPEHPFE